jgi:hypothetical protein
MYLSTKDVRKKEFQMRKRIRVNIFFDNKIFKRECRHEKRRKEREETKAE